MNDQWLVEQALAFSAEHGVPVFPCRRDKSPTPPHGFKDASDDPERIKALFSHPEAVFVAMPSGPMSGISVLDIDVAKDEGSVSGFEWLDANRGLIPQTRTVQTPSGGLHYYFRHVEGLRCSQSRIGDGIDVRAKGGLIIVAGLGYELITDIPFTELPQFPAEVIAQLGSDTKKEPGEPCRAHDLSKIHASGHWHDITRDWVAAAVSRGDSKKTILELAPLFQMPGYSLSETEEELTVFLTAQSIRDGRPFRIGNQTLKALMKSRKVFARSFRVGLRQATRMPWQSKCLKINSSWPISQSWVNGRPFMPLTVSAKRLLPFDCLRTVSSLVNLMAEPFST